MRKPDRLAVKGVTSLEYFCNQPTSTNERINCEVIFAAVSGGFHKLDPNI